MIWEGARLRIIESWHDIYRQDLSIRYVFDPMQSMSLEQNRCTLRDDRESKRRRKDCGDLSPKRSQKR